MASERIDLVWLGSSAPPAWSRGRSVRCSPGPGSVSGAIDDLLEASDAGDFILTWDAELGEPDPRSLDSLLSGSERRADAWHAGLRLGLAGRPALLDFVHPTWMLNADPRIDGPATSWRLSLRCCLARASAWRQLGGLRVEYRDLGVAGLELGHRWLWAGAIVRSVPDLLPDSVRADRSARPPEPDVEDELRFLVHRVGRRWATWALWRAVATGAVALSAAWRAWRALRSEARPPDPHPFEARSGEPGKADRPSPSVSVLVPTLDRYPWLDVLLDQLRRQTTPPLEILVVDQTDPARRRDDWSAFADLPLVVIERDDAGQCSSRNAGLRVARGGAILFLDDDDEIPEDLVERHLENLGRSEADASCGVADEVGSGELPAAFRRRRVSDVFPTNNTLLRRRALAATGLFDLAFEKGARADADLGQRLYLSGALLVLDPSIRVLHHHAPRGGLRRHAARVVTYAESRRRVRVRHLPSAAELYLARRYFTTLQAREADLLRVAGTFALHGSWPKRLAKIVYSAFVLPGTFRQMAQRRREAREMLERFPQIPPFEEPR